LAAAHLNPKGQLAGPWILALANADANKPDQVYEGRGTTIPEIQLVTRQKSKTQRLPVASLLICRKN